MFIVRSGGHLGPDLRRRACIRTGVLQCVSCAILFFSRTHIQATRTLLACSCLVSFETSSMCIELITVRHGHGMILVRWRCVVFCFVSFPPHSFCMLGQDLLHFYYRVELVVYDFCLFWFGI